MSDSFSRKFGDKLMVTVLDDVRDLPEQKKSVCIFQADDPDGDWQIDFPLKDLSNLIFILQEIETIFAR